MADEDEKAFNKAMESHYAAIGKVTAAWAGFEHVIQFAIWGLAGVDPSRGACVTTQIGNSDRMMDAVISLLRQNGIPEKSIKPLIKFADEVGVKQRKRNRIIHDPWAFRVPTGEPFREEMSAKKRLVNDLISTPTKELEDFEEQIRKLIARFEELLSVPVPLLEILK